MSGLPTSLTVLRPIGFGSMRGPDGSSLAVLPNSADDEAAAAAPSPSATNGQALRSPSALAVSPPLTPAQRNAVQAQSRPGRDERQMRMAQAARSSAAAPPRSSAASLDDVGAIEIDDRHSDGEAESSPLGLVMPADAAASSAAAAAAAGPSAVAVHPAAHHSEPVEEQQGLSRRHSADLADHILDREHEQDHEHEQALALELGNASAFPTPASNTRSVLLDEAHLPVSTVPPLSRQKILTFDELKHKSRWKVAGMQALAGATFIMGVTSIGIGAASLETKFLYPSYPVATIVAGVLMALFAPLCAFFSRRFKLPELRAASLVGLGLGVLQLVLGILTASRKEDEIRNEVRMGWSFGGSGYDQAFKDKWGSEDAVSDAGVSHRNEMVVAQLLSVGTLVALGLLCAKVAHILSTHLSLVELATASKSESSSKATRRAREVAAYKDAMARDPELARNVELERIPAPLKAAKKRAEAAASKKYASAGSVVGAGGGEEGGGAGDAATGTTPHTRSRHLSTKDKDKEKDRAAKEKERAERHKRKKEKRDAEKARAARAGQAGVEVHVPAASPRSSNVAGLGGDFSDHDEAEHKV